MKIDINKFMLGFIVGLIFIIGLKIFIYLGG